MWNEKKLNEHFDENLLADMIGLIGCYQAFETGKLNINETDFEEYYINKYFYSVGVHFGTQRRVDKVVYSYLKKEGVSCKKSRFKRFYRYNKKRKPKISIEIYYYFKYVMDYILGNEVLTKIALCEIFKQCNLCAKAKDTIIPYKECLEAIFDWQYFRISDDATGLLTPKERKVKAKKLLEALHNYDKFAKFKTKCIDEHK